MTIIHSATLCISLYFSLAGGEYTLRARMAASPGIGHVFEYRFTPDMPSRGTGVPPFSSSSREDKKRALFYSSRTYKEQPPERDDAKPEKKRDCPDCDDGGVKNGESGGMLCPFKYIVYFVWFSIAAILTAIAFVMDLSTGYSEHFTARFLAWAVDVTESIYDFFIALGCG